VAAVGNTADGDQPNWCRTSNALRYSTSP
jgi:hypothetical protein